RARSGMHVVSDGECSYYGRDPLLFFFQAEDGIRDFHVTGVQTCALPICSRGCTRWTARTTPSCVMPWTSSGSTTPPSATSPRPRSEERRVGNEGRTRCRGCLEQKDMYQVNDSIIPDASRLPYVDVPES